MGLFGLLIGLMTGPEQATQPPPAPQTLHGYLWFEPGSLRPILRGDDPIEMLAPQIPPGAYVLIRGKADSAGDKGYNLELSRSRALMVADRLVRFGVSPGAITIEACGEAFQNRPTADGVSEPMNRFVSFDWRHVPFPSTDGCRSETYAEARASN